MSIHAIVLLITFSAFLRAQSVEASQAPVEFLGRFSNMVVNEATDHEFGSEVLLWHDNSQLFGHFIHQEGAIGLEPTGVLSAVSYNPKTHFLSFKSKLTIGFHPKGPTKDVFTFTGKFESNTLVGTLSRVDMANPKNTRTSEEVVLKKKEEIDPAWNKFKGKKEWDVFTREVLKKVGPKW